MKAIKDPVLYFQDQVDQWEEQLHQESDADNRAVCTDWRDEAAALNAQFQRILYAYQEQGTGLTLKSKHNYCVVLEDATEPGRFRYQIFDTTGFTGHVTRDTAEEVLLDAFRIGFHEIDTSDALERFSKTKEWKKGALINDLVRKVNCGQMSHKEANQQYEAGLAQIYATNQPNAAYAAQ